MIPRGWWVPPQVCYCADHSQRSQGLIEVFCFPALWNECLLQLYNVVGIYAVKRCFILLKINFRAFEGTVFYYWYLYLIATKHALYIARGFRYTWRLYRLQLITNIQTTLVSTRAILWHDCCQVPVKVQKQKSEADYLNWTSRLRSSLLVAWTQGHLRQGAHWDAGNAGQSSAGFCDSHVWIHQRELRGRAGPAQFCACFRLRHAVSRTQFTARVLRSFK
jgi:hypothetical protein